MVCLSVRYLTINCIVGHRIIVRAGRGASISAGRVNWDNVNYNYVRAVRSVAGTELPVSQKPKYQLRKTPITASDENSRKNENWRPLEYIQNDYKDNGDGTITDHATDLMWREVGIA